MGVLSSLLTNLVSSIAYDKLKRLLAGPDLEWADEVVEKLRQLPEVDLTNGEVSALVEWLKRPDVVEVLVSGVSDKKAVDKLRHPLAYELGQPADVDIERVDVLIQSVMLNLVRLVDEDLASSLANQYGLQQLMLGQNVILEAVEQIPDLVTERVTEALLAGDELVEKVLLVLPLNAAAALQKLNIDEPNLAKNLARQLASRPQQHRDRAKRILGNNSPDLPSLAFECVAAVCAAHGDHTEAAEGYERAAALDAVETPRLLISQATNLSVVGDSTTAAKLLEEAEELGDSDIVSLSKFTRAAIANDSAAIIAGRELVTGMAERFKVTPRLYLAMSYLGGGDHRNAIDMVRPVLESSPDHSQANLLLAKAHLARSASNEAVNRANDRESAFKYAQAARNEVQRWAGDSGEALAVMCQIRLADGDVHACQKLLSDGVGSATEAELNHEDIRRVVNQVQVFTSPDISEIVSPFYAALRNGFNLRGEASQRNAVIAFREALDLAANQHESELALKGLATLGIIDEKVDELDEHVAVVLKAVAKSHQGNYENAVQILRPLAARDRAAAYELVHIHRRQGKIDETVELCELSAQKFNDGSFSVEGVACLVENGDLEKADGLINRSASRTPDLRIKTRLRKWQLDIHQQLGNRRKLYETAETALNEGLDDPAFRWLRVEKLTESANYPEAETALIADPSLNPETERNALLTIEVYLNQTPPTIQKILDLIDEFQESEIIGGSGSARLMLHGHLFTDEQRVQHQTQVQRFFQRFPDSQYLKRIQRSTIEELHEAITAELPETGNSVSDPAIQLYESTIAGRFPVSLMADQLGKDTFDLFFDNPTFIFPIGYPNAQLFLDACQVAALAIDKRIVIDVSSLATLSRIGNIWPDFTAEFTQIVAPVATIRKAKTTRAASSRSGVLVRHPDNGMAVMLEISDSDAEAIAQIRRNAKEAVSSFTPHTPNSEPLLNIEAFDNHEWQDAIQIAKELDAPFLCDDPVMAALAKEQGMQVFNTTALAAALNGSSHRSHDFYETILRKLFELHTYDLPITHEQAVALCTDQPDPVSEIARILTRGNFWSEPEKAIKIYHHGLQQVINLGSEENLGHILNSACTGIARSHHQTKMKELTIATLLGQAVLTTRYNASQLPLLLARARAAAKYFGLQDPLKLWASMTHEILLESPLSCNAGPYLANLAKHLEPEDRTKVTRQMLER